MPTWEYHKATGDENLHELGREGWELVAVVPAGPGGLSTFYFKRPAPSFREQVTEDQKRRYYALYGLKVSGREEGDAQ